MMYVRTYVRANVSCALLFQLSQNHTRDLRNVIRTYVRNYFRAYAVEPLDV